TQRNSANAELSNARTNLELNSLFGADYSITSSISGLVYDIFFEPGEIIPPGQPIAILGDPSLLELRLNVDEADIALIKAGQEVLVELDSYPGKVFRAKVQQVHPLLNPRDQTFRVDARFTDAL